MNEAGFYIKLSYFSHEQKNTGIGKNRLSSADLRKIRRMKNEQGL